MSDNYLQCSEVLKIKNDRERDWLLDQLSGISVCGRWEARDQWQMFAGRPPKALAGDVILRCSKFLVNLSSVDELTDSTEDGFSLEWTSSGNACLYIEDQGDVSRLAHLVQQFLQQFYPQNSWSITWAETCSEHRPGEFSGGGVLVTAAEMFWQNAYTSVREAQTRFEKLGPHVVWDKNEKHPVADWQYEVANDDTRLGYWDWVLHQFESEEDDNT